MTLPLSCWSSLAAAYGFAENMPELHPLGNGLIHRSWRFSLNGSDWILQQLNTAVFRHPEQIADNINRIGKYLEQEAPDYLFVQPLPSRRGITHLQLPEGWFRIFPFVPGSQSLTVADKPETAYEAARQFGGFTRRLTGFPASSLHITLPRFHDLPFRFGQFRDALHNGIPERVREAAGLIRYLQEQAHLVRTAAALPGSGVFKIRVTHHDTKISNVLLDADGKGLCVIDLDTVMPGYFISDAGDMIRTCCPSADEECTDWQRLNIRTDYFEAIAQGYLDEMASRLTPEERAHFVYAGQFMVYMQALRFLTDFLTGDGYYGARYPGHNLNRAQNQSTLLRQLLARANDLSRLI